MQGEGDGRRRRLRVWLWLRGALGRGGGMGCLYNGVRRGLCPTKEGSGWGWGARSSFNGVRSRR